MTLKNYFFIGLFILVSYSMIAQETVLCSLQTEIFKVENSENVPMVTFNGDDTVTLEFLDQNVTDVFGNHTIYDFFQTFPNTSETLQQYYTIAFGSKNLLEDMNSNVAADIIVYADSSTDTTSFPIKTAINQSIIDNLEGNAYELTKFIFTSDTDPCGNPCTLIDVPDTLSFIVSFNYDITQDILYLESYEPTTCGNSFTIGLKGGNPNYFGNNDSTLQLWESTPSMYSVIESPQSCSGFESEVFSVLDISCYNYNVGNIDVFIDSVNESFQFYRENMIFGYHILEFSKVALSVEEESFEHIQPFQIEGNPYLQIVNLNNRSINIEIFNTSGQGIIQSTLFEENSLDISNLTTGLYFIKLSYLNNQQNIFKFLKI